jgi:hypothetical protein
MSRKSVAVLISAFIAGFASYVAMLLSCNIFGIDGSATGICTTLGGLLRFPFLMLLPGWGSQILGMDAAIVAVVLNAGVWGFGLVAIVVYLGLNRGK